MALYALSLSFAGGCDDGCPRLESCDIRDGDCQREVALVAACLRGGEPAAPIVTVVDADAFVQGELAMAQQEEPPSQADAALDWGLSLLKLANNSSPSERIAESWREVAAFYDSETRQVTVLDRGDALDGAATVVLLLHEFVHAMQHAELGDDAYLRSSVDQRLALAAMVEGEAVHYQDLAAALGLGFDPSELDWDRLYDAYERLSWGEAHASAEPVLHARRYFAYANGGSFMSRAWRSGGAGAVRAVWAEPPSSSREVAAGYGEQLPYAPPDAVGLPLLPAGFERAAVLHLGAWLFAIFLERLPSDWVAEAEPPPSAYVDPGMVGDVLTVFRRPASEELLVAWRLRFDSESRAQEVALELASHGVAARRERIDVMLMKSTRPGVDRELLSSVEWGPLPSPEDGTDEQPQTGQILGASRTVCQVPRR